LRPPRPYARRLWFLLSPRPLVAALPV